MPAGWLFLIAYACSGLAGLIYEVSWTRLLTLHMGHTTAAASTVVAAFMGGLAVGAAVGGRFARQLTPRRALFTYAGLESAVILMALVVPFELAALKPLLSWSYRDGALGVVFPIVRTVGCFGILMPPTIALGATFPIAVRWFVDNPLHPGRGGGKLYAANTGGAALGALAAGFVLMPAFGMTGTVLVGICASALAIGLVLALTRYKPVPIGNHPQASVQSASRKQPRRDARRAAQAESESASGRDKLWLAATVLALTGFATFVFEIAWTRLFSMILGPSTYAFAGTLTALIAGTAGGSALGSVVAGRTRRPALPLALALAGAAIATSWACSFAGGSLPRLVAAGLASQPQMFDRFLLRNSMIGAALVLPTAAALGVAFPLSLELGGGRHLSVAQRLGSLYAVNSIAGVAGALVSGFVAIPIMGLQHTLQFTSVLLVAGALAVVWSGSLSRTTRGATAVGALAALGIVIWSPPWDHELLASGLYKYTQYVTRDSDVETALTAGTLLYYREGTTGTVSVKRLTGTVSLAIDGKTDASTSPGDMLTQKLLAHLPLLIHADPHSVCIIGLGSGVTLASALVHPVASVDVVEISPEVIDASRYFKDENHDALTDRRTRLVTGDGRSHVLLSSRSYDVIISEPSNPWMAGIAALFTREFFAALRSRLTPGGIVCQWAHTYDISDRDLRSVAATFASVFPNATMWLVGSGDLLFVGSADASDLPLANITPGWERPGVAADLSSVSVSEPFVLSSLFVGGPAEIERYARGAALQTDDRMALEFSGPRALYEGAASANNARLLELLDSTHGPPVIANALATATAAQWRNRGAMMLKAEAYGTAYQDFATALTSNPADDTALGGLVRAAVATRQQPAAIALLRAASAAHPRTPAVWVALSRIFAATGSFDEAVSAAKEASSIEPTDAAAVEQLASVYADAADGGRLEPVVQVLQRLFPDRPGSRYYAAASQFLHGRLPDALRLAQETIALDPQRAASYNLLGAIHASLGETQAAREAFEAALRLDPRDSATYTNLGLLDLATHKPADAVGLFAEALSLDPVSAAARGGLAQARAGLAAR